MKKLIAVLIIVALVLMSAEIFAEAEPKNHVMKITVLEKEIADEQAEPEVKKDYASEIKDRRDLFNGCQRLDFFGRQRCCCRELCSGCFFRSGDKDL